MDTTTTARPPGADAGILSDVIAQARKAGASDADAVLFDSASASVTQRLGEREELERSESRNIGLRVFDGQRQAIVSTTDLSHRALDELVDRAVKMAKSAPENPYCGLADPELLAGEFPDLDLDEPGEIGAEALYAKAAETEDAARAIAGVTNSDGASASWGRSRRTLVTSGGFAGSYSSTGSGCGVSVISGEGTNKETDYAFTRAAYSGDLIAAAEIGSEAGKRAVKRLNPRKADSGPLPVMFEPRVANSLVRHLASAISGPSIARKTSFLRKAMGERVFADGVTIVDDPLRPRGLSSRPFDGEGVATRRMNLIDKGVLTTWLLSSDSARQLGLRTTGHAARGTSSPPGPSPSNLYLEAGNLSPDELAADIAEGVWITDLFGMGINMVTGDYSRGAAGFWIKDGARAEAISEFTIAGNLKDMFLHLTPANDLEFRRGTDAPTVRVDGMTVAGK